MKPSDLNVTAIILAAGRSSRMGQPKMLLQWGETTVLGQVIHVLHSAGITSITVVTGGFQQEIEVEAREHGAVCVFNPDYGSGEMLSSIKTGILAQSAEVDAVLIALGDNPQIDPTVVQGLLNVYQTRRGEVNIIIPSYQNRRGHPWIIQRSMWGDILALETSQSMRDFFKQHASEIIYHVVESPSVLKDLDTPQDYASEKLK